MMVKGFIKGENSNILRFYELGCTLKDSSSLERLSIEELSDLVDTSTEFMAGYKPFHSFFIVRNLGCRAEALEFLKAFSGLVIGYDSTKYSSSELRALNKGLIAAMFADADRFSAINVPVIERVLDQVNHLLKNDLRVATTLFNWSMRESDYVGSFENVSVYVDKASAYRDIDGLAYAIWTLDNPKLPDVWISIIEINQGVITPLLTVLKRRSGDGSRILIDPPDFNRDNEAILNAIIETQNFAKSNDYFNPPPYLRVAYF